MLLSSGSAPWTQSEPEWGQGKSGDPSKEWAGAVLGHLFGNQTLQSAFKTSLWAHELPWDTGAALLSLPTVDPPTSVVSTWGHVFPQEKPPSDQPAWFYHFDHGHFFFLLIKLEIVILKKYKVQRIVTFAFLTPQRNRYLTSDIFICFSFLF